MKRGLRNFVLLLCAAAIGWGVGEILHRQSWGRSFVGKILGRGEFLGVVRGQAIYARDLFRGMESGVETIMAAEVLRRSTPEVGTRADNVEREMELLRAQFAGEEDFNASLEASGLSEALLRARVADYLEVRSWLGKEIAPELRVTEEESRRAYDATRARFQLPIRFRASHLFIAAPEGTDEETVLEKRSLAQGLSVRLLAGETLAKLAAEASEDEATKEKGGDLGYFSAMRMPPDFMIELQKLTVGQTSAPFRGRLGFHIIALTEMKPAGEMTFEEARPEIETQIANAKRAGSMAALTESIRRPEWSRSVRRDR